MPSVRKTSLTMSVNSSLMFSSSPLCGWWSDLPGLLLLIPSLIVSWCSSWAIWHAVENGYCCRPSEPPDHVGMQCKASQRQIIDTDKAPLKSTYHRETAVMMLLATLNYNEMDSRIPRPTSYGLATLSPTQRPKAVSDHPPFLCENCSNNFFKPLKICFYNCLLELDVGIDASFKCFNKYLKVLDRVWDLCER